MSRLSWRLAIASCLVAVSAYAGDPTLVWKTVESDHFVVHYYEPLDRLARRTAVVAERAHRALVPVFGYEPEDKTHIVLVDDTDGANGFANVLPRNVIRLFAAAPTALSVLNDHDDWLYDLVVHEYTHILHLGRIGGLPALYNKVFGRVWAPNQIQPQWIVEGIATMQESAQTASGRIRSRLFDMFLRVAVLEGRELKLDALSTGPRAWPHGTAAYLYGGRFLDYVFRRYGTDKIARWAADYGSTAIPFAINRSMKRAVGKTIEELYEEWLADLRARYRAQLADIDRRGRREGRRLTFDGETDANPQYTPDGKWIVWWQADGRSRGRFRAIPRGFNIGRAVDYLIADRSGGFDVLPDGDMIVERTRFTRTEYRTQDLYWWDRQTGRWTELTAGMRARDPQVSPDGRQIAAVVVGPGASRLAVLPLRPEARPRIVWDGGPYAQASAPSWSPDGTRIALSAWRPGGYRDILIVDLASGDVRELMRDRAIDVDPVFDPGGRYLYYSSDRSGVYNIYAYDLDTGKTWQVTNVVGGAFGPDVSPDGRHIVYQGYDVDGFDLFEIRVAPARWLEPEPYVDDRPPPPDIPDDSAAVTPPRPYRPLETLAPRSYRLQAGTDSFGSAVTVSTSGADVAGWHGYTLAATIGVERGDVSVGGAYAYRRLWPTLRVAANRSVARRSGYFIDGRNTSYIETNLGVSARVDLPVLLRPEGSASLSVDYDADWFHNDEDEFDGYDPNEAIPQPPETDIAVSGIGMSFRYSDVRGYTWTLGPREGTSLIASVRLDHPAFGSSVHALNLSYRWEGYLPLPWGDTPVLALRLAGGITTTDRRRTGVFVLGGVPDQDIPRAIRDQLRASGTGYLRGYPPRSVFGRQFHLLNAEYRQVVAEVERGLSTLPVYVRRLHVAGLVDVGDAFNDSFDLADFKVAVGAALRLDVVLGYFDSGTIDVGYARGLTDGGVGEYWLLFTSAL